MPLFALSQVTNQGNPISWKVQPDNLDQVILPDFDLKKIQEEDKERDAKGDSAWRFGYEHQVDISLETHGSWTNLSDGSRFWLLNIKSKDAKTMNFIFDEFYLPKGGKLYFYNADQSDLLGAYTHSQNREDMIFGSWLVDGDDIYIEYFEPANKIGKGQLHIDRAVHGYRSVSDFATQNKGLNDSGPCNLDVDCSIGADFDPFKEDLKKSVGLIVVGGSGFCTGALINNTNNDGTPYFLTANHCLGGSVANWAFRFNWRSPNPQCATFNNSTNGTFNQTISGANLLANNGGSDFALLEITAPLPSSWDLVWAGWDRSPSPADFTVGIHHPSGDIMKVCRDDDSPSSNFIGGAQVWFLNEWETGVTEPGSSGSPLFNQDGRIVGQLFGGQAACAGINNNQQYDYYGKFNVSWNNGSLPSNRLKDWLDPNNINVMTLDQYPSSQTFAIDAKLNVLNTPFEVCGVDVIQPSFEVENLGSNPLTSVDLTYQMNNGSNIIVNWTGNLQTGQSAVITSPELAIDENENTLTAILSSPNNNSDGNESNNSVIRNIVKTQSYETTTVNLELVTDNFGSETTWVFADENGNVIAQGGPYGNSQTINESFIVNFDLCYDFTLFDTANDGICCGYGFGSYTLTTDDGTEIFNGGEFGSEETIKMSIVDNLSLTQFNVNDFEIYPNPTSSIINIQTNLNDLTFDIYDIAGKRLINTDNSEIDLSSLSPGVYLLKITGINNQFITKKIIKK